MVGDGGGKFADLLMFYCVGIFARIQILYGKWNDNDDSLMNMKSAATKISTLDALNGSLGGARLNSFLFFFCRFWADESSWIQNHWMDIGFLRRCRRRLFSFFVCSPWAWCECGKVFFFFLSLSLSKGIKRLWKCLSKSNFRYRTKIKETAVWNVIECDLDSAENEFCHFYVCFMSCWRKKRMMRKKTNKKSCAHQTKKKKFSHGYSNGANPLIKIIVEKKKFLRLFFFPSVFNLAITLTIYDCFYGILHVISLNAVFFFFSFCCSIVCISQCSHSDMAIFT